MITIKKLQKAFTQISNNIINDNNLSMQAIGLFCYLWSKPDDWEYYKTEIMKRFNCGETALNTALKLLEENNYLFITRSRGNDGKFTKSIWYLSDDGNAKDDIEKPSDDKPHKEEPPVEKPHIENPHVDNQDLLIYNNTNKYINKKEVTNKKNKSKKDFDLPDFIDAILFDDFLDMRKKIKKPATDRAIQNIINKLIKFEERRLGYANQCLNQSITNCWQDVYEPKQDKHSQYLSNHEKNMIQLERFLKETNDEQEQDESIMTVVNNWSK